MRGLEWLIESALFSSRWLLTPFYLGLVLGIVALLVEFAKGVWALFAAALGQGEHAVVVAILSLVDLTLVASLLLIILLSGYENFVSKILIGNHEDRPAWMGKVGFADLKIKLMGSIVAISAIELLRGFFNVEQLNNQQLAWRLGIHLAFVVSGVLFAITDRIAEGRSGAH